MSSLQKTEFPTAIYMNLFDQDRANPLWNLFLTSPEITGSRNAQSVKVRKLGAFTASTYGGAGSIDPSTDYERPSDTTITVNFDEVSMVLAGVDNIEHEITAIGFEGSKNALAQDATSAVIDDIVTKMLITANATATDVDEAVGASINAQVLIDAGLGMDSNNVPKGDRVAVLDSSRKWDLYDGTSKVGFDNREFSSMIKEGIIPRLFGMDIFDTNLLPTATNGLFFHKSAVIAKVADEMPNVKVIDDTRSLGELLQIWLRYGKSVADTGRIFKHRNA